MTISKETKAFAINFFLPPTGALVVASIAYLSGVKVTFAPFLPESLFRSTLDAFLLLVIAYVLFLGGQRLWSLGQATRIVMATLGGIIVAGLAIAIAGNAAVTSYLELQHKREVNAAHLKAIETVAGAITPLDKIGPEGLTLLGKAMQNIQEKKPHAGDIITQLASFGTSIQTKLNDFKDIRDQQTTAYPVLKNLPCDPESFGLPDKLSKFAVTIAEFPDDFGGETNRHGWLLDHAALLGDLKGIGDLIKSCRGRLDTKKQEILQSLNR